MKKKSVIYLAVMAGLCIFASQILDFFTFLEFMLIMLLVSLLIVADVLEETKKIHVQMSTALIPPPIRPEPPAPIFPLPTEEVVAQ